MKIKFLIFAVTLLIINNVMAQKKGNAKLYAYLQPVASGVSPNGEEYPDGTKRNTVETSRGNYFLYISYNSSSAKIYPTEIWINGERHGVNVETISKTPVTKENYDPAGDKTTRLTLVPKTSSKVLKLNIAPASKQQVLKVSSLAKTNGLVVVYKYQGQFYYTTLTKIKMLDKAYML